MNQRWKLIACGVLALSAAAAFAQDEPKPSASDGKVVVKARCKNVTTIDGVPMVALLADGARMSTVDVHVTDGVLVAEISGAALDRPGWLQIWDAAAEPGGLLVVFRDSFRGEIDLGEVALGSSAPILVSGRVVGSDGKAVYGAKVSVMCRLPSGNAHGFADHSATSDASGAFAIRGEVRGEGIGLELHAEGRWQTEHAVRFGAGAKDVKVVVEQTSRVHGTVVVPDGLSLSELVVVMRGPPGGIKGAAVGQSTKYGDETLEFPAQPSFDVAGLVPGTYDVRLKFRGSAAFLARLPDVVIDETARDLPALRVTEPIRHVRTRVLAADGSALAGANLWARSRGDRGKFREIRVGSDGAADVAFLGDGVTTWACGGETDWVSATTAGPEATLTPPAAAPVAVSVELPGGARRTDPECDLVVVLQWYADASLPRDRVGPLPDDTDPRAAIDIEIALPSTGPAKGTAFVAGWYRIGFRAERTNFKSTRTLAFVRVVHGEPVSAPLGMTAADIVEFLRELPPR